MVTEVDKISKQIARLDGEAQRQLLRRLPGLLKTIEDDPEWLRLAEEEYARRKRRIAGFPLKHLSRAKQQRMDELAERHSEGELSEEEEKEYFALVDEAQRLTIDNARRLAQWFRPELFDEQGQLKKETPQHAGRRAKKRS